MIHELASRPALERLREAIAELDDEERALAASGLLLGIVIDENRPEYERGDFLVRGLLGVDEETGSITVGEHVRVGQTVRLHVRDGASADEDLREVLRRQLRELRRAARRRARCSPATAAARTCSARPTTTPRALEHAFGRVPAAGFFCAGEIGPVGQRNFLHGFTATIAVFAGRLGASGGSGRAGGGPPRAAPARAAPASDSSSSSPAGGPTNCTPIGRPSVGLVQRQRDRRLAGHVPDRRERHEVRRSSSASGSAARPRPAAARRSRSAAGRAWGSAARRCRTRTSTISRAKRRR